MSRRRSHATDDEHALRIFVALVDDMVTNRKALTEGTMRSNVRFDWQDGEGMTVTTDVGDEEHIRSLMLDIRKMMMSGEVTNFYVICNILERRLTDAENRDYARGNRGHWKDALARSQVRLKGDGASTPEEWFDLIAYGGVFHSNPEYVARWQALPPAVQALAKSQLPVLLADLAEIAFCQRNVVSEAFEKDQLDFSSD